MSVLLARLGLIVAAVAALLTGLLGMRAPVARVPASLVALRAKPDSSVARLSAESLAVVVREDPFRVERRPSPVAYDPLRPSVGPEPTAPPVPKPVLTLSGIVWGEEPSAVIEGLPGTEGPRVVHMGESFGTLRIRRLMPTQVVITGMDTAWTLSVKESWR